MSSVEQAALRDACAVHSVFHSGARNMFLTSAIAVSVAGLSKSVTSSRWARLALAGVSLAVLLFGAVYGLFVAEWHRKASKALAGSLAYGWDVACSVYAALAAAVGACIVWVCIILG